MSTMKKVGIGIAITVPILLIVFLMAMPPLTLLPQEAFIEPTHAVQSDFSDISDPARRLFVERGSYLAHVGGCTDCHTPQGAEGPDLEKYLAGGIMLASNELGGIVSANLTSDKETGLGAVSDEQILRALRSGIHHEGRQINYRAMPWAGITNMSEEDLRALVAYLREVDPVRNRIPTPPVEVPAEVPEGAEMFIPGNFGNYE